MSCIKEGQIWKNLVGEENEYMVEKVSEDGWVNGVMVKKGTKEAVKGTGLAVHHDTMKNLMEKVS